MSDDERTTGGAPDVRSSGDEPAVSRDDARVPGVDDWQDAADGGAASRAAAEARRAAPAWTPASAALPMTLHDELVAWCRDGLPNEACGLLVGQRFARGWGHPLALHRAPQRRRIALSLPHRPR